MKLVNFYGTLYKVEMKRDGGGRLQIDFGGDCFEELLKIQRFFKDNDISVAMALVPHRNEIKMVDGKFSPAQMDIEDVPGVRVEEESMSQETSQVPEPADFPGQS